MRILLQNLETKLYLARGGTWTDSPETALAFLDEVRARDHSIYHRLLKTKVIVMSELDATNVSPPVPFKDTGDNMITNTEPKEIAKQTGPKFGQLSSARSSLLHPPAEPTQKKAERKALTAKTKTKRQSSPPKCRTVVQAQIDVGYGNSLFIRGEGAGLSWDKGQPLTCVDGKRWDWSSELAKGKVVFKLLLNDTTWTKGENVEVRAGKMVKVVPQF